MKSIAECFAANMKVRRKSLHLTQEQLAERTDMSKLTIQQIETGKRWFGVPTLAAIARELNCSEIELFQAPIEYRNPLRTAVMQKLAILPDNLLPVIDGALEGLIKSVPRTVRQPILPASRKDKKAPKSSL